MRHTIFNSQKVVQTLLFILLLTPLVYFPWIWRPAQVSKVLFFVSAVTLVLLVTVSLFQVKKMLPYLRHPVILSYGVYVFFVAVSSLFGLDMANSFLGNDARFGGIMVLFCSWVMAALLFLFFDRVSWKKVESFFVFSGVFISLYAILELLRIVPDLGSNWPRSSSIMGNPIYLAAYLIFPFTIALTKIRSQNKWSWNFIVASVVIAFGLLSTGTRGLFLGLIVGGLVAMFVYFFEKTSWKKIAVASIAILAILVVGFFLARSFIPKTNFFARFVHFDESTSSRVEFWKMAYKGVKDHSLIGVGYENFYIVGEKYFSTILYERGNGANYTDKPHNVYVEVLICSGLIGLIIYLMLLGLVFRSILQARKQKTINHVQESILIFGFVTYLIQNFFAFDTIGSFFTFSFFVAYVCSLSLQGEIKGMDYTAERKKQVQIILLALLFCIFSWFYLTYVQTTYTYFSILARADRETNDEKRFKILKSIDTSAFMYDQNALGKIFHNNGKILYNKEGKTQRVNEYIQAAIEQYDPLMKLHPYRGEYWFQRADVGLMKAFLNKTPIDEGTKIAVNKAIEYTPTRTEPYLVKSTELELEGKLQEAVDLLEEVRLKIPNSNKLLWTLSVLYAKSGKDDLSAEFGYQSIDQGLNVAGVQSILDLVNYFAEKKDYKKVISLYQRALILFPEQIDLNANLAAAYVADGQIEKAIEAARKYELLKPEAKADTELFIQSLQAT